MKGYKNIKELNKEWSKFGFRINEKGELIGTVDGKEYKCGKATFYNENGKTVNQEELNEEKEIENEVSQTAKSLKTKNKKG